jgi:hypothetical protein
VLDQHRGQPPESALESDEEDEQDREVTEEVEGPDEGGQRDDTSRRFFPEKRADSIHDRRLQQISGPSWT